VLLLAGLCGNYKSCWMDPCDAVVMGGEKAVSNTFPKYKKRCSNHHSSFFMNLLGPFSNLEGRVPYTDHVWIQVF